MGKETNTHPTRKPPITTDPTARIEGAAVAGVATVGVPTATVGVPIAAPQGAEPVTSTTTPQKSDKSDTGPPLSNKLDTKYPRVQNAHF
jgi:hypothetical protein